MSGVQPRRFRHHTADYFAIDAALRPLDSTIWPGTACGTCFARPGRMATTAHVPSTTLLRWVFQMRHRNITCCVDMVDNGSAFDVCLLPHWDLTSSTIERFDDAANAFEHHAEIALTLRAAGWVVAKHSPRHSIAAV